MNNELVESATSYVKGYFSTHFPENLLFHSFKHTQDVLKEASELALAYNFSGEDLENIQFAALFHDIGYATDPNTHEEVGIHMLREYLKDKVSDEKIAKITSIIEATKMGNEPNNIAENIIKDADSSHLGKKNYVAQNDLLRLEWESRNGKKYTDKQWILNNIDFLENHKYHTQVAEVNYSARKEKNLKKFKNQLEKLEPEDKIIDDFPVKMGRGVETMYRVTLRNHNNLSRIADNKASIMLSINALMISIVLSALAPKLDSNPNLTIPMIILITVCLVSITFAILSARPNYKDVPFNEKLFRQGKFNVLFFGNFHSMPLDKFEWALEELMKNEKLLYSSLSKDLFFLGKVLLKKYNLLRICYNVFMFGLIISAIAFVISFYMGNPLSEPPLPLVK